MGAAAAGAASRPFLPISESLSFFFVLSLRLSLEAAFVPVSRSESVRESGSESVRGRERGRERERGEESDSREREEWERGNGVRAAALEKESVLLKT